MSILELQKDWEVIAKVAKVSITNLKYQDNKMDHLIITLIKMTANIVKQEENEIACYKKKENDFAHIKLITLMTLLKNRIDQKYLGSETKKNKQWLGSKIKQIGKCKKINLAFNNLNVVIMLYLKDLWHQWLHLLILMSWQSNKKKSGLEV